MTVEKEIYTKHGVHKGTRGSVISDEKIHNKWEIIFTDPITGQDIADINVDEKHFTAVT